MTINNIIGTFIPSILAAVLTLMIIITLKRSQKTRREQLQGETATKDDTPDIIETSQDYGG